MNGTGMTPTPYDVGVGSPMKVLLLLILIFAGFIFFASTSLANVDLTPDTPAVVAVPPAIAENTVVDGYDIVTIQDSPATALDGGTGTDTDIITVPVTGVSCSDPYTVRQGDMLSSIAILCNTSLADIRLANPEITNANMIYAGQQIRIPGAAAAAQTVLVPVTSGDQPQVVTNPLGSQDLNMAVIAPGTGVQASGINFPANTPVYIAIGPQSTGYTITASGVTD